MGDIKLGPITTLGTLAAGQNLAALSVVGINGANKLVIVNSANSDGSQTAAAVLPTATNAVSDTQVLVVVGQEQYKATDLVFGGSDTSSTHFNALGSSKAGLSIRVY
jgi:hypothetical protein